MKQSNTDTNSPTMTVSGEDAPLYSASGEDAALDNVSGEDAALDNVSGKYTLPYNSITKWLILALIAIGVVEAIIGVCSGPIVTGKQIGRAHV